MTRKKIKFYRTKLLKILRYNSFIYRQIDQKGIMQKTWNIGNTTVRNPKRIDEALRVFVKAGFSGNAEGDEREGRLHEKLRDNKVLEFDGEPSSWNGRKWRAAFYQLGLISSKEYKIEQKKITPQDLFTQIELPSIYSAYQITPAGQRVVDAKSLLELEEVFIRQYCCYEIPNAIENKFATGRMKPFILFLEVLFKLQKKKMEGLTKFETGLFIQKFRNHTNKLCAEIVDEITDYRHGLSTLTTPKQIKNYKEKYKKKLAEDIDIKPDSVVGDYADTTFRYFSLSGLFTRDGDTIIIRPNKINFVKQLIDKEPTFLHSKSPAEYFKSYYKNGYSLPTDNIEIALEEIKSLEKTLGAQTEILKEVQSLTSTSSLSEVQKIRYRLKEYDEWEREQEYAVQLKTGLEKSKTLQYLKVLNGEKISNPPVIDDKPAYLEWATWRALLAINDLACKAYESRRFPVDHDFYPRFTAPGGGADLVIEYKEFVLIVEVTLTTLSRQMSAESEPVRRHTAEYVEQFSGKEVICLFIAPNIDNNVLHFFRDGIWYNPAGKECHLDIVPINLSTVITIFEHIYNKNLKRTDLYKLLKSCLSERDNLKTPQWSDHIKNAITRWMST